MEGLRNWRLVAFSIVTAGAIAACSSMGSNVVPTARSLNPALAGAPGTTSIGDPAHRKRGKAKFRITIPREKKHRGRRPKYISASTKSMTVAVTGGSTFTYDLTPGSSGCTSSGASGSLTCTETAILPTGSQTLTVTLFDETGGTGNQLATASTTVTIKAASATTIPITLGGIVATASAQISGTIAANVPIGTPTSLPVTVNAYDADGNLIIPPGDYTSPITLTDSDTSGATSFTSSPQSVHRQFVARRPMRKRHPADGSGTSTTIDGPGQNVTLYYNGSFFTSAAITPSVNGTAQQGSAIATLTGTIVISEYKTKTSNSYPSSITEGSNGAMWFTEDCVSKIGQISTSGTVTEYKTKTGSSRPQGIAAGPDGNLWFAESAVDQIGKITTSGTVTEYTIPSGNAPGSLAPGSDGAMWFTEYYGDSIARITTDGTVTEYEIPTPNAQPNAIAAGPDGALWFTEYCGNNIGRVTTNGTFAEYSLPVAYSRPNSIAAGPDGALWFTELCIDRIGRITTDGHITEYSLATTKQDGLQGITAGTDGALWFTEGYGNRIGRITTDGSITEYTVPTSGGGPEGIAAGPNSTIWFAETCVSKIGML